jgi:adenylyltransferase/sulfurtransferase
MNWENDAAGLLRYRRQIAFGGLGLDGQRAMIAGRVLIVGVGGLGSWTAELLARAGVGFLRLADSDTVDLANVHRQALYDEMDARLSLPKAEAAAQRLGWINQTVRVEPVVVRVGPENVESLAEDTDLILDGTDNFATRFLINDVAVKLRRPWVFAGVVGAEAQTMTIIPGRTPCLRCVLDSPPPPCQDPTCEGSGVLGPAVAAVAALQAMEAIKLLAGRVRDVSPYLTKLNLWSNTVQRIGGAPGARSAGCICCGRREFEFLEP